jgi:cellulose synthase/poly-beta-1,6-N-acetylglucosamine synthase-like glycosyltransferase
MDIGIGVFAVLFVYIFFVFIITIIGLFKKDEYIEYEPEVSVIVPCYNEQDNISECLDAVYSLDYPKEKLEVIIVDDGSSDSTVRVIEYYSKTHKEAKRMILLKGNHEGKSASLNLGIKKASNEIILTLDADTIVEKESLKRLVRPFSDKKVGATNGSFIPSNKGSLLGIFQNIEYSYYNLVKKNFSSIFNNGIWFFGAFTCYRKEALKKIGFFKKDSMTEDMDASLEMYSKKYRLINVYDAIGYTIVPSGLISFFRQRTRWWIGGLQAMNKNLHILSERPGFSELFVFLNQYWWSVFSVLFFPLTIYQIFYWMPHGTGIMDLSMYLFRWFSLSGPVYVIYKIPDWGMSFYSIFGVLSGIISSIVIIIALLTSKARSRINDLLGIILGIFFYFPYTIILNAVTVASLIRILFLKKKHFIY